MPGFARRGTAKKMRKGVGSLGPGEEKFRKKQILQSHGLLNGKRKNR